MTMTKEVLNRIIGENIRAERSSGNLSIDQLADMLTLSTGFIGLIERGRRGVTAMNLYKLSEIFGVPVDSFFSKPNSESPSATEETANRCQSKRKKVAGLTASMSEGELDFIIDLIKGLKKLSRSSDYSESERSRK